MLTDHGSNATGLMVPTDHATTVRIAQAGRWESPGGFDAWRAMAAVLASDASGNMPADMVDNPAGIIARMLQAQALDLPIWTAIQELFVVTSKKTGRGKVGMSASLVRALILRAGHQYEVVESTKERCVMTLQRSDQSGKLFCEWTIAEAQIAGLLDHNKNWQRYPTDMLVARCSTRMGRRFTPDVLHGMGYTREELVSALQDDFYPGGDDEATALVAELVERAREADDKDELTDIAEQGQKARLMNVYTDQTTDGGAVLPLRSFLHECWRRIERAERDEDETDDEAGSAEDAGVAPDPEVPVADADETGSCGCKLVEVVANGGHHRDCPHHISAEIETEQEQG